MSANSIPASLAMTGELVTTFSLSGGVGCGRLIGGTVFISSGNGFFDAADSIRCVRYDRDGGRAYRQAVDGLFG